jgi:hypothetical protein
VNVYRRAALADDRYPAQEDNQQAEVKRLRVTGMSDSDAQE